MVVAEDKGDGTDAGTAVKQRAAPKAGAEMPYKDETIRAKTGKTWAEWLAVMDGAGMITRTHPEMTSWLHAEHPGVSGWWLQGVAVGYERARGLRVKGQTPEGFSVSTTKTIAVPVETLYAAWSADRRPHWLRGDELEVTTANPPKAIRARWGKSHLAVSFSSKGKAKAAVTVEHLKLPTAKEAERMKAFWKVQLDRLVDAVGGIR
jgi:uncharacterized protein YndB with AHSA1/START domain